LTIFEGKSFTEIRSSSDAFCEEVNAFIEAIETGSSEKILNPYEDACKTLEVTLAVTEAMDQGKTISIAKRT
jgi:hypothetical protein